MTSEIRANTLKNRVGLGTVSFTNTGPVVSGIVTANSFSGPYNGTDIVGTGLTLTSTDTGSSAGPELKLFRNSASPADADYLGQLKFAGESDTGVERNYAKITGKILDASNGTEDGILEFAHIKAGSQTITGRWRSDSLQLLNGTNLSVAGDTTLTGDLDVDGHTNLDNTNIVGVATVSTRLNINTVSNARLAVAGTNYAWRGQFMIKDTTTGASAMPYMTFWDGSEANDGSNTGLLGRAGHVNGGNTNERFDYWTYRSTTPLSLGTNGYERLRILPAGQTLITTNINGNTISARTLLTNYTPTLQIEGVSKSSTSASLTANVNNAVGPSLWFAKTRGTSLGSNTAVQDDDELGTIVFNGADGTDIQNMGAYIRGEVDGSVSSNDVPGRLQFHTATGGTMYERLRITSTGQITTNVSSTIFADINTTSSNGAYCNFDIGANGANIGYLGSANHLIGGGANTDLAIRATNDFRLSTGGSTQRLYIQSTGQLTHSTSATLTTLNTSASNGAYLHLNYGASGALTGYLGAGSHLISGSGVNDFGIRSANHFDISTGGSSRRLSIRSGGQVNIGGGYTDTNNILSITDGYKGFPSDSVQPEANFILKLSDTNNRWIGIGASSTAAWIQASGPGSSGPTASLAINPAGGYVSIGTDVQDGLLTIKGNSDATSIPSIRLLDGSDTREVSITNQSGDFIASTHGTDNTQHGSMKIYDSGIIAFATNSGAGNAERLRVDLNGGVRHMGTAGYWQITVIHNGSGSGNWYSGSAPQRIYPNYIDNRTGYAEFYMTFHPSTSYSGYGEPTFIITGESYLKTGGTIELNYNDRTNSPNNGTFRCYHGEYSWQIYNDGDTDQVSGQREINRNVEHRSSSYVASSTQSVDYIPSNDGRYGTNTEPIMDQRSYIKIKMNAVGSHNAIQNHTVFVKFTTYTQGDKTWQAYMQYN